MGDMADDFRALREAQREAREARLVEREAAIDRLPPEFSVRWFTLWHVEINGRLQLWPSHGRYWDRKTNKRGRFTDPADEWIIAYLKK